MGRSRVSGVLHWGDTVGSMRFAAPVVRRLVDHCALRLVLAAGLVTVACSSNNSNGPHATGVLSITITAPAGVAGAVTVTGPNNFGAQLSTSGTLTGLAPGEYTIRADSVVTPDALVGTRTDTASVAPSSVTVSSRGTATATVAYTIARAHGVMLVGSWDNNNVVVYSADQLRSAIAGHNVTPIAALGGLHSPSRMDLDPDGDVWVGNDFSDTIAMFTPEQIIGGASAPARVIVDSGMFWHGVRFDTHGNMWVLTDNSLDMFAPNQVAAGGIQAPSLVITLGSNFSPVDIVFDSAGSAWVSDQHSVVIWKVTAAQLTSSGSPVPVDTLDMKKIPVSVPGGMVLDPAGNLFVAIGGYNWLIEFTASQLAAGGTPTPVRSGNFGAISTPYSLAFDQSGDLWVSLFNANTVADYTPGTIAALTSSNSFLRGQTYIGGSPATRGILFDPAPSVPAGLSTTRLRQSARITTARERS